MIQISSLARSRSRFLIPSLASRSRRRGVVAVYTAAFLTVLLAIAAMIVDMGALYRKRIIAQRSADAAALAGAWQLAHLLKPTYTDQQIRDSADAQAKYYALLAQNGGYPAGNVSIEYPAKDEAGVSHSNWYRVGVKRSEKTFFAISFGRSGSTVAATATAIYTTLAPINIKGLGTYGVAPGPVNLSVFGPDGKYAYGDCYSTKFLDNGTTPNPDYNPKGYDFIITVPKTFKDTTLEIYDPDCYNANGPDSGNGQVDEYRRQNGDVGTVNDATTTLYSLYDDRGTATQVDDILLYSKSYGADSTTDGKWVNFYSGDRSALPNSNFRLNVVSTAGASENGFDLRIGKTRATPSTAFDPNNGSSIAADGHLPMNFNQTGTVKIALGALPIAAAGGTVDIRKFDTDVGAGNITYTLGNTGYVFPKGTLAANGTFATDSIAIPSGYNTEQTLYAEYQAGTGDTSVWDMSYSNSGPGRPGTIKLIR